MDPPFGWRRLAYGGAVRGHLWVLPDDPLRHVLRLLQERHDAALALDGVDGDAPTWTLAGRELRVRDSGDAERPAVAAAIVEYARGFDVPPARDPEEALDVQYLRGEAPLAHPLDGDAFAAAFERLATTPAGAGATRDAEVVIGAPRPPDMVCFALPRRRVRLREVTPSEVSERYRGDSLRPGVHVVNMHRDVGGREVQAQISLDSGSVTVSLMLTRTRDDRPVRLPEARALLRALAGEVCAAAGVPPRDLGEFAETRVTATLAIPSAPTCSVQCLAAEFPGAFEAIGRTGVYAADPDGRARSSVSVFRTGRGDPAASLRAMPSVGACVCAAARVLQAHEVPRRVLATSAAKEVLAYRFGKAAPRPKTVSRAPRKAADEGSSLREETRPAADDDDNSPFLAAVEEAPPSEEPESEGLFGGATKYAKRKRALDAGEVGEVPVTTVLRRALYIQGIRDADGGARLAEDLAGIAGKDLAAILRGSPARVLWSVASPGTRARFVAAACHALLEQGKRPGPEAIVDGAAKEISRAVLHDLTPENVSVLGDLLGLNLYALSEEGILSTPETHWKRRRTGIVYFPQRPRPPSLVSVTRQRTDDSVLLGPGHALVQSILRISSVPTDGHAPVAPEGAAAAAVDLSGHVLPSGRPAAEVLPFLPEKARVRLALDAGDRVPEVPLFPAAILGLSGSPLVSRVPWTRDDAYLPQATPYAIFPWFAPERVSERVLGHVQGIHVLAESSTETAHDLVAAASRFVRKTNVVLSSRIRARAIPGALRAGDECLFLRALAGAPAGDAPPPLTELPGESLRELWRDPRFHRRVPEDALEGREPKALEAVAEFEAELIEAYGGVRPSTDADLHVYSSATGSVAALVLPRTGTSRPPPPRLVSAVPSEEIRRYLYLIEDWDAGTRTRQLHVVRMVGSTQLTVRLRDLDVAEILQRVRP